MVFIALSRAGVGFSSVYEHVATAAARSERTTRAGVRHHGIDHMVRG